MAGKQWYTPKHFQKRVHRGVIIMNKAVGKPGDPQGQVKHLKEQEVFSHPGPELPRPR